MYTLPPTIHLHSLSSHFCPHSLTIHLLPLTFHSHPLPFGHLHPLTTTSTHLSPTFHLLPPTFYSPPPASTHLHIPPLTSTHLKSAKIWPILEKFVFNKKACNFVQTVAAEEYASTIGQQKCFRRSIMVRFSRT